MTVLVSPGMSTAHDYHNDNDERVSHSIRPHIDRSTVLTRAEEVALFTRIRASGATTGPDVEDALRANLRLCHSIAKATCWRSRVPLADRFQMACKGCLIAIGKFDPTLGNKFSTYATYWIRQAIQRSVIDTGETIRLPVHMVETRKQIVRAAQQLAQANNGEAPSAAAIVAKANDGRISAKVYQPTHVRQVATLPRVRSIHDVLPSNGKDGKDLTVEDALADTGAVDVDEAIDARRKAEALELALSHLDARTETIMRHRYGLLADGRRTDAETLGEVADRLGLSRERARQLEKAGVKTLTVLVPVLMVPETHRTAEQQRVLAKAQPKKFQAVEDRSALKCD